MTRRLPSLSAVALAAVLAASAVSAADRSLIDAARNSDRAAVASLLKKGANPNDAEGDGATALHWAAYRDDLESVDLLLKAGAKANAANDLGATPLWAASQNGSEKVVRRLLEAGADPNLKLITGETPVMVAARGGYARVIELLASKGANVNGRATRGQTALMWAASQKHPETVKVLLKHGADVKAKSDTWSEVMGIQPHGYLDYNKTIPHGDETALLFAVRSGDLESAKLLVAAGSDVNAADAWGVSATTLAAHSNFTDIVVFLLDRGADASAAKAGFSALHLAAMYRNDTMAAALLSHGANPNDPLKTWTPSRRNSKDFNFTPELVGATPLWLAARFGSVDMVRLLIGKGADPAFVHHGEYVAEAGMREDGFPHHKYTTTPLMAAMGMGGGTAWVTVPSAQKEAIALESAKLLAVPGVDLNLANTDGKTALDAAYSAHYTGVVTLLTERGAKSKGR